MAAPVRVNPAEDYHEHSKYAPATLARLLTRVAGFDAWRKAQPFDHRPSKAYPGAALTALPRPRAMMRSLGRALHDRRSSAPGPGSMRLRDLATLLWAGQGAHADGRRTTPSAGGLYPLELYVLARDVDGLAVGSYHYDPLRHVLEFLGGSGDATPLYLEGDRLGVAPAHIVVTAVLPRLSTKYDLRGYRFALQETGHAAQNVALAASALGLAALPVGGFYDDRVHDHLELDGIDEVALYLVPVGPVTR